MLGEDPLAHHGAAPRMLVGVDFGAPRRAREQRRKLVAIAAMPQGERTYRVDASGFNARILSSELPGWRATELLDALLSCPARIVGFDFPFGVPRALLDDEAFGSAVGDQGAFGSWQALNRWIAEHLPLTDPLDFAPFSPWRDRTARTRLWSKRATDEAAGAQPPLKDLYQATFQMTLLGNALLAKLANSRLYRVVPFPSEHGAGELIEVYPRATLRSMGLTSYKSRPDEAVRLALAACARENIAVEVEPQLLSRCREYSSGTPAAPDHDVADAFVALCTAILYAEGACRPLLASDAKDATDSERIAEREGVIWAPSATAKRP